MKTRRQQRGVLNHSHAGAAAGSIRKKGRVILTVTQLPGQFVLVRDHRGIAGFTNQCLNNFCFNNHPPEVFPALQCRSFIPLERKQ